MNRLNRLHERFLLLVASHSERLKFQNRFVCSSYYHLHLHHNEPKRREKRREEKRRGTRAQIHALAFIVCYLKGNSEQENKLNKRNKLSMEWKSALQEKEEEGGEKPGVQNIYFLLLSCRNRRNWKLASREREREKEREKK